MGAVFRVFIVPVGPGGPARSVAGRELGNVSILATRARFSSLTATPWGCTLCSIS